MTTDTLTRTVSETDLKNLRETMRIAQASRETAKSQVAAAEADVRRAIEAAVREARDRADFQGARTEALAIAALRTTTEETIRQDGAELPAVRGTLMDGREAAFYPGELPDNPAALLAPAAEGAARFRLAGGVRLVTPFGTFVAPNMVLLLVAVAASVVAARAGREGLAFTSLTLVLVLAWTAIMVTQYPVVLPSTVDPQFSLTAQLASSGPYTLGLMAVISLIFVPIVLAYTGWSYWMFRRRLADTHIPEAHLVEPL